jgi:rubrerythrin
MKKPRLPYYELVRLKKGGGTETVLRCAKCDVDLEKATWQDRRNGVLYEFQGWKCPNCGAAKEEAYNLIGNEG